MSLRNVVRIHNTPLETKEIPIVWSGGQQALDVAHAETFKSPEQLRDELLREIDQLRMQLVEDREQALQQTERETQELAEKLKDAAWEQGFANGKEQAEQQAQAILSAQLTQVHNAMQQLVEERKRYVLQAEHQLIEMSTALARELVGKALQVEPHLVKELVKKHLKLVEDAQEVTLHVSLEDFEWIKEQREELESLLPAFTPFVLLPVKELNRGDVMIHTQASRYDARIDSQLSEIKTIFMTLAEENVDAYLESNTLS